MDGNMHWVLCTPREGTPSVRQLSSRLVGLADVNEVKMPQLPVSSMDTMMEVAEKLPVALTLFHSVIGKVARRLESEIVNPAVKDVSAAQDLSHALMLRTRHDTVFTRDHYLTHFNWDSTAYGEVGAPLEVSVEESMSLVKEVQRALGTKLTHVKQVQSALTIAQRRLTGPLTTRSLEGIVTDADHRSSEFVTTLYAVVPRVNTKAFLAAYEGLSEYVVPRSVREVFVSPEDRTHLYGFCVVRSQAAAVVEAGKLHNPRFQVRVFDPATDSQDTAAQIKVAQLSVKTERGKLKQWLTRVHSTLSVHAIHLTYIRASVEGILRFGIPENTHRFLAVTIKDSSNSRAVSDVRANLAVLFQPLSLALSLDRLDLDAEEKVEPSRPGQEQMHLFPYVHAVWTTSFK